MTPILPLLVTFLAGIGIAVQAPTNAALARASGSAILAALVSFAIGTAVLLAAWITVDRTSPSTLAQAPGWGWLGGLYGAIFVTAAAFSAPRLGVSTMLTVAIASQLLTALVLDRYGLIGLARQDISLQRLSGVLLVLVGVVLVRRG